MSERPSPAPGRPWELLGTFGGLLLGAFDFSSLLYFGADLRSTSGIDLTWPVGAAIVSSFGGLGWLAGRVLRDRTRARQDAATIASQLAALERSQSELLQSEKLAAIGRLAAGVAHEVRNPLGVIRASASMIRDSSELDPESLRACDFIRQEIDRLNGLISSLLEFARPAELRTGPVSLEKAIDHAVDLAAPELESRGIALERDTGSPIGDVRADADLLAQVVLGLLVNASQATDENPGGGRIALRTGRAAGEAWLEVADNGSGIAETDAPRIFEPFFTTKDQGTGLGLAMASRIVEAHRGTLVALQGKGAGGAGRGACLCVRLPLFVDGASA